MIEVRQGAERGVAEHGWLSSRHTFASKTDGVHFLQIWIVPDRRGVASRYQQVHFSDDSKRGRLKLIISPNGQDGSLGV